MFNLDKIIGGTITQNGSIEKNHKPTGFVVDQNHNIIILQFRDTGWSIDNNNNILDNYRPTGLIIDQNVIKKY